MAIDTGDTTWMLLSTGLVMLMCLGLGFFMAGLLRGKNAVSTIMQTFSGLAIISILWFILTFSLVFAPSQGGFIGGFDWLFLNNVPFNEGLDYAPTIPGVTFVTFQMMFGVITPLLIIGGFADRLTFRGYVVFILAWSIFVYSPVAHWIWGGGWLEELGVADFAGGIVIHTTAGMASIASALYLGRRKDYGPDIMIPHNMPLAILGATLLWLGWFGFNGGSALAAGGLAANAVLVSQLGASASLIVWLGLSWKRSGKPSSAAAINGAISGLAGVTPAAGFIGPLEGFLLGIVLGFASYYGIVALKERLKIDDALDVGSVHGITGIIGALAIGIIASSAIDPDGPVGWLYGNPMQLAVQALGITVVAGFTFGVTLAIMKIIDATIGLKVRAEEEDVGLDITQHAEQAYVS